MNLGLRKASLSTQLALLMLFPVLLTLALLVLTYFNTESFSVPASIVIGILMVGYLLVALVYIKRLVLGFVTVKQSVEKLAEGKFTTAGKVQVTGEIAVVSEVLAKVQQELKLKTEFASQIRSGELQALYELPHAGDLLGKSLLEMKDHLIHVKAEDEKRNWASDGLARFVEVLRSNENLKKLSNDVIILLVKILHANQGALFLIEKDTAGVEYLEMQACYANARTKHFVKRVAIGEGLLGQTFLEKRTVYLKDVPGDFVQITSGLGGANPNTVLIFPLMTSDEIVGVAELASFSEFSPNEILFVEKIGESIAHTISSIRTAERTRQLLNEAEERTEQMRAQEEELRQNQEELQATQEEISRKYNELFNQLGELNYQARFDQLRSITLTRKRNVEYYFDIIRNQILTFSENKMIVEAVREFKAAFSAVGQQVDESMLAHMKSSLKAYYTNEFMPRLKDNTDTNESADRFFPDNRLACILQYHYIANNAHPTGQKASLDNAGDGSEYSSVHERYHPIIRSFLEKFGYYDIFLLDSKTGDMLYSVFKEVDYATSLLNGLYSETNFGEVVQAAMESDDKNFVRLIDFEPYDPSYRTAASFIACPVYDGDEKTGVLVFQMPINKINQILTGDNNWIEDGLGRSGETFIVGQDFKLRSIARELIEKPEAYLASLRNEGIDSSIIHQIRKTNTSILLEEIKFDSVTKALQGEQGTIIERTSSGDEVLNAYAPLDIPNVKWAIVSTMHEKEVSERINSLRGR